ncbi:MAG: magnesium transporter [Firmicutes bacterium]|jgi:magnesium transporter|nr:magnesium transporter [Bacillota bacterium]
MRIPTHELEAKLTELVRRPEVPELAALLEELQPYDLAEVLPAFGYDDIRTLLGHLDPPVAAEVLEHLEYFDQYRILDHMDRGLARRIVEHMPSDALADLVGAIHPKQAQQLIDLLPPEHARVIEGLLDYPEYTAGGLMTVEYISVRSGMTVEQVLQHIRKVGAGAETVAYIYVIDGAGRLVGVVSVRELLLAEPDTVIADIMGTQVVAVPATMHQEEVAQVVAQYDFVAIPVVDAHGRMAGIITVDDLVDVIHDEATEDFHKLGGSEPLTETYFQTPVHTLVRKRIGWILILFLAEAYTGTVLRHFESVLSEVVALTFFIPLLIGTGGNTGSQVVTTLVRGLAVGEVRYRDMGRVLLRELGSGLMIGLVMGGATFLRAYTLGVGLDVGRVVALTALFIVVWASAVAAVLPLILHRLRVDPAIVSGPFITTVVDGTGLFMYFTIARMMLGLG